MKVILIILDGLRFDVSQTHMGYLAHLIETSQASLYKVQAELPTLSRPIYEVLLTGTPVSINGITTNQIVRLSHQVSLFHLAVQHGLSTAAAAYSWFSELYNRVPFDSQIDREQHDHNLPIQHGKFYWDDHYPDSHLFADAERLRLDWNPDLMLVHPMGLDYAGHTYGAESKHYHGQAIATDGLLAQFLPGWLAAGYDILITADHGMNADGQHGGNLSDVREVPLVCIGKDFTPGVYPGSLSQLAIAPLICQMLSLPLATHMQSQLVPGYSIGHCLISG